MALLVSQTNGIRHYILMSPGAATAVQSSREHRDLSSGAAVAQASQTSTEDRYGGLRAGAICRTHKTQLVKLIDISIVLTVPLIRYGGAIAAKHTRSARPTRFFLDGLVRRNFPMVC